MSTAETEKQRLLAACKSGDLATVRDIVEAKLLDVNTVIDQNYANWTPLHHASA